MNTVGSVEKKRGGKRQPNSFGMMVLVVLKFAGVSRGA
jgi:hypothetical protein